MKRDIDVLVSEVGPRDGLQSIQTIFTTEGKMDWIRREAAAGVRQMQVGSFVNPKLLPQMADSAEVVGQSVLIEGLIVSALVPNMKGAVNGLAAGAHQIGVVMSVSEAHNQANIRRTVQESLNGFAEIVKYRDDNPEYRDRVISGGMATSFGCTISGAVPLKDVMRVAEGLVQRGADRLNVADTVGYANPKQVRDLFTELYRTIGTDIPVGAHFHDTRGLGLANVFAALDAGVREFDSCLGGLGGCPYAPGASGNIVTEDLVFMLEAQGMRTGVDLDGLLEAREIMERQLKGEPVHGTYINAGPPKGFTPATAAA
ncbi:MAG: hydroxymethylglutaryl-CoA lyase [Rhodospirillales bacterium CG15_BIG_FIL_POST_REV_8_21_14_020_66_15]|nr:MAG: hydroxymethylglutaryl-CoA lyase [Rhodospirillales bacterium CG15_BIG_FIL_POST_REV_8_21_14_020_66_15]